MKFIRIVKQLKVALDHSLEFSLLLFKALKRFIIVIGCLVETFLIGFDTKLEHVDTFCPEVHIDLIPT